MLTTDAPIVGVKDVHAGNSVSDESLYVFLVAVPFVLVVTKENTAIATFEPSAELSRRR